MLTEQQIDAAVSRYEPGPWGVQYMWSRGGATAHDLPDELHARLTGRPVKLFGVLTYPTREAARADLRRAIALSGTNAGS